MPVEFYDKNAEEFFNSTVNADMSLTQNFFIKNLSQKVGEILDLGCGSGRDSKVFIDAGYKVTAIDLSPVLANVASEYIGQKVIVQDMRTIDYEEQFIGIWACASLLHLSEKDIFETIKKCKRALKKDGILYLSFKVGEMNYVKDGRNFTVFTEDKFLDFIKNINFYEKITFETDDVRVGRENEKWLNVILKKK